MSGSIGTKRITSLLSPPSGQNLKDITQYISYPFGISKELQTETELIAECVLCADESKTREKQLTVFLQCSCVPLRV